MATSSIKLINYEAITTTIMDVVMPNRDKEDKPAEIARQLKMINILAEKLLSNYLNSCLKLFKMRGNEGTNLLLYYEKEYRTEMEYVDSDHEPVTRANIIICKNTKDDKEGDLYVIRPSDYPNLFNFNLYPDYSVDDEPKSDVDKEIITHLKFIKENKLDECYDKICGIYFNELLKYASKKMHDLGADLKEFRNLIRVNPDYIITPVSELGNADNLFIDMLKVYNCC